LVVEEIQGQAERLEREYDWLGAAESYEKALKLLPDDDLSRKAETYERLGYALYRAAFQAESSDEFKQRLRQTVLNYEKAEELYGRLNEPKKTGMVLRCNAVIAYLNYWLASEVPEKKTMINECLKLAKDALRTLKDSEESLEFGKTCSQLLWSAGLSSSFETDFKVRENTAKAALELGEQSIMFLSPSGESHQLARAYAGQAARLEAFGYYFRDLDKREGYFQKAADYWEKAVQLSEEAALIELLYGFVSMIISWGVGTDKALANLEKALGYAEKTKDRFLIGSANEWLVVNTFWKAIGVDDPDRYVELLKKAIGYAENAKHQYDSISFTSPLGDVLWVESPYAEYYWQLCGWETNIGKRRELLEKAAEATSDLLSKAEKSGIPQNIFYAHHVVAKVITAQAIMETNPEEKRRLLEKSLEHRNQTTKFAEDNMSYDYWNRGVMQRYLAGIKSELAALAEDDESKKNMLQEAAADTENALKLLHKELAFWERKGTITTQFFSLAIWQYTYGNLLKRLYDVTHDKECLRKATEAFEDSAESAKKLNVPSWVAEVHWRIAQTCDELGQRLKAAENFNSASSNYREAAAKIPQLKDFFLDHAVYMQAWTEIEKARYHHARQEYGLAKEHFEKAAELHKSLKKWSYLAPNYSAWANVERAEDLSRTEQCEEAIQAFEQALKLFEETKRSLCNELSRFEDLDEKRMANSMVKATDMRREYCLARIALEEAKILDKKGDHYFSSEKYGQAAEAFEKIGQALETDQDRKEFNLFISLSQAWQKMTQAEAEASSTLYAEASQLFEKAKEYCPSEEAKMLVLGHSRFCKALEEGTKFIDTRDAAMHASATKYLESASDYYMSANFQKASEYAKATQLLFDAYAQMDNAKRENDPEKKAKLYVMAEKVLQTSAGCFMKAEHPEKRERVLRLLDKVEQERELALTLTEVLHAPSIVSSTMVFTTPTPSSEQAVGSERFEHADIQANLIVRQKELKIGESLSLEMELVNAGKGPALLIKVNEIIPEGFELVENPEAYRVEDSYINMKGRRLDPLKAEELRLVLKPKVQGVFPLKPKILYLDENGKCKTHEPEPVTITVKELGIKGWIKGER
jgi:hypothetical protein